MEKIKTVHTLQFGEDGTSALKTAEANLTCELVGLPGNIKYEKTKPIEEELQGEYDFYIAETVIEDMKNAGIISLEEYIKIREESRKHFLPYLAELA